MSQRGLESYLASLRSKNAEHLFVGKDGRIAARFFNARLSSVFQSIRSGKNLELLGYEAMVRSFSINDTGLSILKLLEHVTTDDESVELDRLCRLLHVLNFFRQGPSPNIDLYLSVHSRLLTAVTGNHGAAFQRVLASLEISQQRIVLQLPAITPSQGWAIAHVAKNYRSNGFRFAVHARNVEQAFELLDSVNPDVLKLNAENLFAEQDLGLFEILVSKAEQQQCRVILRKVDQINWWCPLQGAAQQRAILGMQGNAVDIARSVLPASSTNSSVPVTRVKGGYGSGQRCCI